MAAPEIGPNDIIIHLVNPYKCLDCGTEFFHKNSFLQHLEDHMTKQKSLHPCHQIVCGVGVAAQQPNSVTVTKDILQINENQIFELQDTSLDYTKLLPLKILEQAGILHLPTPEKVMPTSLSKLHSSLGINLPSPYVMQQDVSHQGLSVVQKQANSSTVDLIGNLHNSNSEGSPQFDFNNLQNFSSGTATSEELQSLVQEALMENGVIKEEVNMVGNASCSPVVQINLKNPGHCSAVLKNVDTQPPLGLKPIAIYQEIPETVSGISKKYEECKVCFMKFANKDTLMRHQVVHSGDKTHSCFRCFKQFSDINSLTKHVKIHQRCHQCPVCLKTFLRRRQMELHLVQHKKKRFIQFGLKYYEVQVTTSRSPLGQIIHEYSLMALLKNVGREEKTLEDVPVDQTKKFPLAENSENTKALTSSQENLSGTENNLLVASKQLVENLDNPKIVYRCGHCKKLINTRPTLSRHLMLHTNEKPFSCDLCGKRFRHKSDLFHHQRTHSKPVKCNTCGSAFSKELYLQNHLRRGCPFLESDSDKFQVLSDLTYQCNLCSKVLKTKANVVRHLRIHAFSDKESDSKKISKNINKSVSFGSKDNQNETVSDNVKDYFTPLQNSVGFQCLLCKEKFRFKSFILIHIRMHLGQRSFKCKTCGKGFFGMYMLRKHQHNHTKPFKCPRCGKGFNRRYLMTDHFGKSHNEEAEDKMKDITFHTEDQLLECDICGKTMKSYQKSLMQSHIRLHKDVRPHQCKVCQKSFISDIALKKHSLNHSRPYQCQVCSKGYSRRYLMLDHFEKVCKLKLEKEEKQWALKGRIENATDSAEAADNNQIIILQEEEEEGMKSSTGPFFLDAITTEFDEIRGTEVFKCVPCDKVFTLRDALSRHLKTFRKTTKCKYCHEEYEDKHLTLAHQRSCLGVGVSMKVHSSSRSTQGIGEKQEKVLKTMKEMKSKIDSLHPAIAAMKQPQGCSGETNLLPSSTQTTPGEVSELSSKDSASALSEHKDSECILFQCPKCEKAFNTHRGLKIHAASHVRLYKCETCGLDFTQVGKFRNHLKTHQMEENKESEGNIADDDDPSPQVGGNCMEEFSVSEKTKPSNSNSSFGELKKASKSQENHEDNSIENRMDKHKDREMGGSLRSDNFTSLLMQSGTKGRPFSCHLCRKRFTEDSSLQSHQSLVHGVY